ncbi:acyl carrier protein [Desulfosporosinus orientis DSM 765]|uniref:Acyl carrier protein n=1 Tax=Desulfosporosinus orientis (strain ATCC 19365 / DSM 765 / NCIMB 8382 / VKM B-1628 / Singapore I) TaxID=768706 RepID=G7WF60_DESOD|nr:phosphopantetheine-binding protein [Desulfosporosinus orientis]AET67671.1 acyl carrier protein [Desulfosporosinus orientis DSM 765]
MTIETRIIKALQSVLDKRPEITLESRLQEDLQVDSLEKLLIISALEDEFSMTIADDHFKGVETVKDIVLKLRESGLLEEA